MKNQTSKEENILLIVAILIAILLLCMFSACTTQRKATKYFDNHGFQAAKYCATSFPVKDSVGVGDTTYNPANNKDYTQQLDSLQSALDSQMIAFERAKDKHKNDTSCANDITALQSKYKKLLTSYNRLRESYRPCLPDTIRIEVPHYIENTAKILMLQGIIQRQRKDSIKISVAVESWEKKAKNRNVKLFSLLGLLAIGVIIKLKAWKWLF